MVNQVGPQDIRLKLGLSKTKVNFVHPLWRKDRRKISSPFLSNTRVSNPWPMGHMKPRMAMNVAQHKIVNLLKTFFLLISFSVCVFNVWPKTTLFIPVGPRAAESLDIPGRGYLSGASQGPNFSLECAGFENPKAGESNPPWINIFNHSNLGI